MFRGCNNCKDVVSMMRFEKLSEKPNACRLSRTGSKVSDGRVPFGQQAAR
mgnify:CR=1 FL=1